LAFLAAMLAPAVAGGGVLASGDSLAYYWPIRVLVADLWLSGTPPFWNPYGWGGLPLWASIQAGVLNVGNFPFLVAPPGLALNLTLALAYYVAGCGMLAFGRATGLPIPARLAGAIVYMGSGFLLAHMEHVTIVQAGAMLPWLLWAIARHRTSQDGRWAIALAILIGLQVLVGYPQLVFQSALVAGPYALWRMRDLAGLAWRRHLAELVAGAGLGLALGAIVVLPLAGALAGNSRGDIDVEMLVYARFTPQQLSTMLFPYLFGAMPNAFYGTPYWGAGHHFADAFGYAGLGGLMLGVVAFVSRRTRSEAAFWTVLAAIAAVLATAPRPVFEVISLIPVISAMRSPGRHIFEVDVAIAVLAGLGVATLLAAEPARARRLAAIGAGSIGAALGALAIAIALLGPAYARRAQPYMPLDVDLAAVLNLAHPACWVPLATGVATAAALCLAATRRGRWSQGLLLAVLAADLWHVGQFAGFRMLVVPDLPRGDAWLADAQARVYAVSDHPFPYRDGPLVARLHLPDTNLLRHERHLGGAESIVPDRTLRLLGNLSVYGWAPDGRVFGLPNHGLDVFATRQVRVPVASLAVGPGWPVAFPSERWSRLADADGLAVFENLRARPRAWRPTGLRHLRPSHLDLVMTGDASFDPGAVALLDAVAGASNVDATGLAPGPATLTTPDVNHIAVETDGAGPGYVVISEGYDRGWGATVDGEPAAIERVDGLVMGVHVPAGRHAIALAYEPPGLRKGAAGSLLAALLLLGWWQALRRMRRQV